MTITWTAVTNCQRTAEVVFLASSHSRQMPGMQCVQAKICSALPHHILLQYYERATWWEIMVKRPAY